MHKHFLLDIDDLADRLTKKSSKSGKDWSSRTKPTQKILVNSKRMSAQKYARLKLSAPKTTAAQSVFFLKPTGVY